MRMPRVAAPISAALLVAALFAGDAVWTWIVALAAAGAWAAAALSGRAPRPRGGLAVASALGAVAVWSGLSIAWSVAPDLSWDELNRVLVFGAFLAVGLLAGAAAGPRAAAAALTAALGAAVVWALAGKAIPAVFEDGGRAARLRDPIGYWNALALAADALLVLALWLARAWRRAVGVALAYAAVVAVLLAASRAGAAAAVVGVALLVWVGRDRVETALLALCAAVPASLVAAWSFTREALVDDGQPRAERVEDGLLLALLLLLGGAAAVGAAARVGRLEGAARERVGRALRLGGIAAAAAVALLLFANAGRLADEFRGGEVANDPGRFTSLSSNNRAAWWDEAWSVFRAEPLVGAGANTFAVARKRHRETASQVTQPHSVPLQFLAGTGLVGLAVFAALVAAAAAAAVGALRRLQGGERDAALALAIVPGLWLLHSLVDYDWDFVSVTGPALFAVGVLATAGRSSAAISGSGAVAAGAFALAAAVSVATPWLAEREVRASGEALFAGAPGHALDAAERARALDPLSLEPLFAEARVHELRRDWEAALETYRDGVELQPENPEALYQLGLFEFARGDRCSAYVHLNDAYTLDPAGQQWAQEPRALDLSRDWVNAGNCG